MVARARVFGYTPPVPHFKWMTYGVGISGQEAYVEKLDRAGSRMTTAVLAGLLAAAGLVQVAGAQNAPAAKKYKDGEFDIYSAAAKDVSGRNFAQAVKDLDTWKQKFADTDFKIERQTLYILAYSGAGQNDQTVDAAAPLVSAGVDNVFSDPKDVSQAIQVLFATAGAIVHLPNPSAQQVAIASKAAQQLLTYNRKPAGLSDADWDKARAQLQGEAKAALLYIDILPGMQDMAKKDCPAAEAAYAKALGDNPDQSVIAYNLALALSCEKKNSEAVYEFERAAVVDPTLGGGQPDPAKIKTFADSAYAKVHGTDEGLAQLQEQVKQSPLWPAGFHIPSADEVKEKRDAEFAQQHPELALWAGIKAQLTAADGQSYFDTQLKDAALPQLRGTLIEAKPACKSTTLVIAVPLPDVPAPPVAEIALKLDAPLAGKPALDTEVQWKGVPSAFTQSPFLLTMDTEKASIDGLKITPCAAPAPHPVAKKK